jgi:hypothetical protein
MADTLPAPRDPQGAAAARETFRQALRSAATYASDEGTCGWLLSEDQFAVIERAAVELGMGLVEAYARSPYPPGKPAARREPA